MQKQLAVTIATTIDSLNAVKIQVEEEFQRISHEKKLLMEQEVKFQREREVLALEQKKTQEEFLKFKQSIEEERKEFEREKKYVEDCNAITEQIVQLNVGGAHFTTSRATLCSVKGSMLEAMFSGRHKLLKDPEGRYFLDRDPKLFIHILHFLRTSKLRLPPDPDDAEDLLNELQYFNLRLISDVKIHTDSESSNASEEKNAISDSDSDNSDPETCRLCGKYGHRPRYVTKICERCRGRGKCTHVWIDRNGRVRHREGGFLCAGCWRKVEEVGRK
eukprot:TRINITY_DN1695_c0_g1_i1.p1 TRINITY_DN1695_c0_g1~~TRINITY_DN1695_c0_g1_i1.p1  ORF type:complete len:288 (-),score=43.32 TRINITY_DN1695_c0_g1_i1:60-884(-)